VDVQRSSSGCGGLGVYVRAGAVVAVRADGRLSANRQAQTPLEGERHQKPLEKS